MELKEIGSLLFAEAINKIPIINELNSKGLIDMVVLTGSFAQGVYDELSDIDLFVVLPLNIQEKYDLKPEYSFETFLEKQNRHVEISFVTTEKLLSDQHTKNNIFWWNKSVCVYFRKKEYLEALQIASKYSNAELMDKLWTLNFQFKLGKYEYEKFLKRFPSDKLTPSIIYFDSVKIFLEFYLLTKDVVKRFKWYPQELIKFDADLFNKLNIAVNDDSVKYENLNMCDKIIDQKLKDFGFEESNIVNWSQYGLTRLTFQKF